MHRGRRTNSGGWGGVSKWLSLHLYQVSLDAVDQLPRAIPLLSRARCLSLALARGLRSRLAARARPRLALTPGLLGARWLLALYMYH